GQLVHTGQVLASLYSPDLAVTVQNLLDANRSRNKDLLKIARDRLLLWGIDDNQIENILQTGKAPEHLKIRSPMDGHVLKKYVKEGLYVDEGMPLYDVVDLSSVWIQAQVWEEDMAFLPIHVRKEVKGEEDKRRSSFVVEATSRAYPGEKFVGRLS